MRAATDELRSSALRARLMSRRGGGPAPAALGALGDASDDLVNEISAALYARVMDYARPGVVELTDTAIARARESLNDVVDAATDEALTHLRSSLNEIVDQATDEAIGRAKGSLDALVDQAVQHAAPQIKAIVLDTATEALQSGTLQQAAADTKKQFVTALVVASLVTIAGTVIGVRLLR